MPAVDGAGQLEEAIGQGRLAVVDVGDDREVPDSVHGHAMSMPSTVWAAVAAAVVVLRLNGRLPNGPDSEAACSPARAAITLPGAQKAPDLVRLGDPEQGDRGRVDQAAGPERGPERDDLRDQPPPKLLVEDIPDPVADPGQGRGSEGHADRRPDESPKLEPAQLAPQNHDLRNHAHRSRDHRRRNDPADPERRIQQRRGDRRDRQVDAGYRGRHPGALEAEERAGQQEEQSVERE